MKSKMNLHFLFLFLFILYVSTVLVHGLPEPDFLWAENAGSTGPDQAYGVGTDPDGNIYITGFFYGTANFGDTQLISAGDADVFIAKMDPDGNFLWADSGGGVNTDMALSLAVDSYGNSYITGRYRETVQFGPFTLNSPGGYSCNIFIIKIDAEGNWQWAKQAGGGGGSSDRGYGLAIDSSNNIYLTGYIISNASFGDINLVSYGGRDVFIAKMDSDGNFLWAKHAGGSEDDWGYDITVDSSGNIYITGDFRLTASFGAVQITSAGEEDIFAAKLDNDGNFLWAKKAGGSGSNTGYRITTDSFGNPYITGKFRETASFGDIELISSGEDDIFISKLATNGNFLWAKKAGGTGEDTGYGITSDTAGNIYVTGSFSNNSNFGNTQLVSSGLTDIFFAMMDMNGNYLWVDKAGGTGTDQGQSITIDSGHNLIITGYFYGTADFGSIQVQSSGNIDVFTAKIQFTANQVPVYRFFNTQRGGHLYTVSEVERDYIINNLPQWNYEGVKFNVWDGYAENVVPTYRFFNTTTGIHLYTISESERDAVMQLPQWNYEGVKFYVSTSDQIENITPVYRFFNHVRGGHLYTISEAERDTVMQLPQWSYEGIPFFVIDL